MKLKFVNEFIIGKEFMMAVDLDDIVNGIPTCSYHEDYDYYLTVRYYRMELNRSMVLDIDLRNGDISWLKDKMREFLLNALNESEPIAEIHTKYRNDKGIREVTLYRAFELNPVINVIPRSIFKTPEDILCQMHIDLMKRLELM